MNWIKQDVPFWLASLPWHYVCKNRSIFLPVVLVHYFFSLLNTIILWLYHDLCIHSNFDGQLASFHLFQVILNSVTTNILLLFFFFFAVHMFAFLFRTSKQKLHQTKKDKEHHIQGYCNKSSECSLNSTPWKQQQSEELVKAGVGDCKPSQFADWPYPITYLQNRR